MTDRSRSVPLAIALALLLLAAGFGGGFLVGRRVETGERRAVGMLRNLAEASRALEQAAAAGPLPSEHPVETATPAPALPPLSERLAKFRDWLALQAARMDEAPPEEAEAAGREVNRELALWLAELQPRVAADPLILLDFIATIDSPDLIEEVVRNLVLAQARGLDVAYGPMAYDLAPTDLMLGLQRLLREGGPAQKQALVGFFSWYGRDELPETVVEAFGSIATDPSASWSLRIKAMAGSAPELQVKLLPEVARFIEGGGDTAAVEEAYFLLADVEAPEAERFLLDRAAIVGPEMAEVLNSALGMKLDSVPAAGQERFAGAMALLITRMPERDVNSLSPAAAAMKLSPAMALPLLEAMARRATDPRAKRNLDRAVAEIQGGELRSDRLRRILFE